MQTPIPYPSDPAQEIRIRAEDLQPVLTQLLVKSSMFQFDAVTVAKRMLEADLYGVPSHGVSQFCRILAAIDMGDVDPRGRILTLTDAPAFALLDGSRNAGPVAATKGAEVAIAKAQAGGVGVVAVGNSQTLGAAEVYVRLMADANLIGVCCSSTGGATLMAPGTRSGAAGNSALAYAIPFTGSHPVVFEAGLGVESWEKLELLGRYGISIPDGLLYEVEAIPGGKTPSTVMPPAGGALGFGLSLLCSTLAGPLAGGWMPIHKRRRTDSEDSQHFFLALDPARFCDREKFQQELASTLAEIRALTPVDPAHPVRIPGDRGAECFADYSLNGIPVHHSVAAEIEARAAKKKIPLPWL